MLKSVAIDSHERNNPNFPCLGSRLMNCKFQLFVCASFNVFPESTE